MLRNRFSPLRRATTLVEMLFSVSIFGIAGLFVSTLLVEVARHSESSISMIPSELTTYRVIDRVRTELLSASSRDIVIEGSPVLIEGKLVSLEGKAVTFTNPMRGTRMRIWLEDGACLLNPDLSSTDPRIVTINDDLQDLIFRFPDRRDRRRVEIVVAKRASVSTVTQSPNRVNRYTDTIMLRN